MRATIPAVIIGMALLLASGAAAARAADGGGDAAMVDMHAPYVRYHFDSTDMDFTFGSLVLGATGNGGCEIGEAFYTASQIIDGDAASWQEQWLEMAKRVEDRGQKSLDGGHRVSACQQLMRAANYYRFAMCGMLPEDPRLKKTGQKSRRLMIAAGELMDPPMRYFEVPYEGGVLPGFFRPAPGPGPHKTLIMLGGGETFAEDLIFYIMPQAIRRGYNFATADLPGQGLLPLKGMVFQADMWLPIMRVVDYVTARPEVDPDRLAAFGISGGGGFVPQAAQHDDRIKAVVMNSCVVDAYPLFASMEPVVTATREKVAAWDSFHANTVKVIAWRWGVDQGNIPGLVEANKGFSFDPAKVTVPALVLVGQGEYGSAEVQRQQKQCMDCLANKRKNFVITPLDEGASNHCVMENRSLVAQVVFDWLDDTLQ